MKMWFAAIPAILLPSLFSFYSGQSQGSTAMQPIVYVSAQRLLTESTPGKADVARVQALQQQRQAEVRTRQQDLEATRQQLAQASDEAARKKLQQLEEVRRTDLDAAVAKGQADIQTLQRQVQTEFQVRVKSAIDNMMKNKTVRIVLNSDTSVVWSTPGLDVTTEVIAELNKAPAPTAAPAKTP